MSSTESEMDTFSDGEQEDQWLSFLIGELWCKDMKATVFHVDNKGLLEKLKNFGSNSKTKHLDNKIKALREKFKNKSIEVQLIPAEDMLADWLKMFLSNFVVKQGGVLKYLQSAHLQVESHFILLSFG
ncbi:hypothetical protein VP01_5023g3 [Puccinia sorghi]|uniref:Uncharacterized protein n=1 Tax=Puccinia sorghi TaxID=27349 RepID=A0A0L6ULM2_9BASI|nr:hypothetical protein VP01_5023g3 [Puccinia sorghi]